MARYIVHNGTGTVIDLDDDCFYLDGELIEGDIDDEGDMIEAVLYYGVPMPRIIDHWDNYQSMVLKTAWQEDDM